MKADKGLMVGGWAGKGIFRAPKGPVQLGPEQMQRSNEG